jgi:hypothetical protein
MASTERRTTMGWGGVRNKKAGRSKSETHSEEEAVRSERIHTKHERRQGTMERGATVGS